MKNEIIESIALDIAFYESSCDTDKTNICLDSIKDRLEQLLSEPARPKESGMSAEEWMKEHRIKDTSQYWSEKDKRAYKLSELFNHFTNQPKQNGVIRNDRIVDKNIHPSTEKESGMRAEEWARTYMIGDEFSTDQNWSMFFRYADEYHKFASTGREKEDVKILLLRYEEWFNNHPVDSWIDLSNEEIIDEFNKSE